ncbi:YicC family protein [Terrimonas sp.]|uniref:YicC/YloC family endoribonuclease n=1 Tax=Terrimonas sp. TaxID=1914338 RepID=UPI000D51CA5B|nr:YicC/YloC family endoribonuclease [Terrimonas sp.]PVD49822.1 YicC family protein [Terrimonas sp.]
MVKSMTGFGRAEKAIGKKTFLVEIKSLNGKQFEILLKLPSLLKAYEFDIRNLLSEKLLRGTIDCTISLKQNGAAKPVVINTELAKSYYQQLAEMAESLKLDTGSILSSLLKLPEVVVPSTEIMDKDEWALFQDVVNEAITNINMHRINEGEMLERDLELRINNIRELQNKVIKLEPLRQQKIREGLVKLLEENVGKDNFDRNRMEQEMIYYIEKIDINEEQVRLKNHCEYFISLLKEPGDAKGKKLSFVLQEIGREINTTGAKAYDSEIQKAVVIMKDELEKAKEQVLNVL